MKEYLVLAIKGFIIGIANIIPGVSGGTLAITLGLYERLISAISHFMTNLKDNIKFIFPIAVGALLSVAILTNAISYALANFKFPTTLFFVGLIVGGLPLLYGKVSNQISSKNILLLLITFSIVVIFTFLNSGNNIISFTDMNIYDYITLFIVGMIAAATMVIPGISGSFVLMLLGYYEPIINTIKDFTHLNNLFSNICILLPFGIGVLVGIILIAKLIEYLLAKHEISTYFMIIGFILASIISIIVEAGLTTNILFIISGVLLFMLGFVIAYKLGEK